MCFYHIGVYFYYHPPPLYFRRLRYFWKYRNGMGRQLKKIKENRKSQKKKKIWRRFAPQAARGSVKKDS